MSVDARLAETVGTSVDVVRCPVTDDSGHVDYVARMSACPGFGVSKPPNQAIVLQPDDEFS